MALCERCEEEKVLSEKQMSTGSRVQRPRVQNGVGRGRENGPVFPQNAPTMKLPLKIHPKRALGRMLDNR